MSIRHRIILMMKKAIAAITNVVLSNVSNANYNSGTRTHVATVTGGAPPYTYELRQNTSVIDTVVSSSTSAYLTFPTNWTYGQLYLNAKVTDSAAQTLTSSAVFMVIFYNFGVTIYGPSSVAAGSAVTLWASLDASPNGTYAWYYRTSINGGASWVNNFTFFSSSPTPTTGAYTAGETYLYTLDYTQGGVTTTSNQLISSTS